VPRLWVVWVGTGVVVTAAVAWILIASAAESGGARGTRLPPAPPITERDVIAYLETWSTHLQWTNRMVLESQKGAPTEELRRQMDVDLEVLARKHKVTVDDVRERIWPGVNRIVDAVRFDRDVRGQRSRLEQRVKDYEEKLAGAEGKLRDDYMKELAIYRESIRERKESATDAEKKLILGYWQDLDPLVPPRFGG